MTIALIKISLACLPRKHSRCVQDGAEINGVRRNPQRCRPLTRRNHATSAREAAVKEVMRKSALLIDFGHLRETLKQFAESDSANFRRRDPNTGEKRLRNLNMAEFANHCLALPSVVPGSRFVIKNFYDGKRAFVPLPGDRDYDGETRELRPDENKQRQLDKDARTAQEQFHHAIAQERYGGYSVRLGRMVWRRSQKDQTTAYDRAMQKEVDTQIATDIVDLVWRHPEITQIVLVSADSDLRAPVLYARHPDLVCGRNNDARAAYHPAPAAKRVAIVHGPEPAPKRYDRLLSAADAHASLSAAGLLEVLMR